MRVYLVRHGQAAMEKINGERPLTGEGRSDIEKVAGLARRLGISPAEVWESGKLRAAQTAGILAGALASGPPVISRPGLAPNDPVEPVRDELDAYAGDLMIVGHLPFLPRLISTLIGGAGGSAAVSFRAGTMACLERSGGQWQLAWLVWPGLLDRHN